jgi:hypothetical protein
MSFLGAIFVIAVLFFPRGVLGVNFPGLARWRRTPAGEPRATE